jgi:DNA uptake protein ComE-like DNA-binding protein
MMTRTMTVLLAVALLLTGAAAGAQTPAPAPAQAPLRDANTASEAQLTAVQLHGAPLAKTIVSRRPFKSITELDALLTPTLSRMQITEVYGRVFVPVNLNTGSDAEILLIPGIGNRMLREFKEYRPYTAIEQFRREIGKYVSKDEVARLERYVLIK